MADTLTADELDAIRIGGAGWCSDEMWDAVFDHYETKLRALEQERDALQAFKDYVHGRLDEAGVATHPEGPHSAAGCRIGDRLDIVLGERDALREDRRRFEWLAEQLDFDVKIGDADPEAFIDEEGDPLDAWRKAIDCAIGLGRAEAHRD